MPDPERNGPMPMSTLRIEENFEGQGDDFYEALIRAHDGLSDAESHALNARLVLILANHIGDLRVLREALAQARRSLAPE
jgi:Protein of unknown function (DUF2783)